MPSTWVQAVKYYRSFVHKTSFKYILAPGMEIFPNPFPSPSKQIPAGPGEGENGREEPQWGQSGTFGPKANWGLAAGNSQHFTDFNQPAKIPFPQSSCTRMVLTGCALKPFPGDWSSSDMWLCSDLQPGTFQGRASPATPSWMSGQARQGQHHPTALSWDTAPRSR